jgi:hypothetical protein
MPHHRCDRNGTFCAYKLDYIRLGAVEGQLTQVATATHSALGSNVWFKVELARRGPNATVKVNNQIAFEMFRQRSWTARTMSPAKRSVAPSV